MENKGLFGSLFDLSFTELITPRITKVLFILATVVMAVAGYRRSGFWD